MKRTRIITGIALTIAVCIAPQSLQATTQAFSDVPFSHPAYNAVLYLEDKDIFTNEDGVFYPNRPLNRAEAITILTRSVANEADISRQITVPWTDVPATAWYRSVVAYAYSKGVLDGPDEGRTLFEADKTVNQSAFLKMLFLLYQENPREHFGEIQTPLALDAESSDWFYIYSRYGIALSLLHANNGYLEPQKELTRGDAAILVARYLQYKEGRRHTVLLKQSQQELDIFVESTLQSKTLQAEAALTRALLSVRGAHVRVPQNQQAKAMVKIVEAYQAVHNAYMAGLKREYQAVMNAAQTAWNTAELALAYLPGDADIQQHAQHIQSTAKNLADQAKRKL